MKRTQRHQFTCSTCGLSFAARGSNALYCSSACKQEAYRQRQTQLTPLAGLPTTPEQLDGRGLGVDARTWNGTAIERRQADGFVNATAICQANGKRLNHYLANERTQEYIVALAASISTEKPCGAAVAGFPATGSGLVDVRQGGLPHQQGTWIHPRLAVDLARWISPAFAVWMDGWFLESLQAPPQPHQAFSPAAQGVAPWGGIVVYARSREEAAILWRDAVLSASTRAIAHQLGLQHQAGHPLALPASTEYGWRPIC